jgi:farnesyl-diphosphate farnesyltransferase
MSGEEESAYEKELGGKLLASVSRSFYLTLKALPKALREPISLAYLLARTADTMADTVEVPEEVRMQCLRVFDSGA